MGQYFHAVVGTDKIRDEYDNLSSGVKLMEHSWIGNYFTEYVASKIYKHPQKVAWVGDYADIHNAPCKEAKDFWNSNIDCGTSESVYTPSEHQKTTPFDITHKFLVNHTKKEYIDMADYRETCKSGWLTVHPLPILTCMSNKEGSGDYFGPNSDYAGSWAWHLLEITDEPPNGYTPFNVLFLDE